MLNSDNFVIRKADRHVLNTFSRYPFNFLTIIYMYPYHTKKWTKELAFIYLFWDTAVITGRIIYGKINMMDGTNLWL